MKPQTPLFKLPPSSQVYDDIRPRPRWQSTTSGWQHRQPPGPRRSRRCSVNRPHPKQACFRQYAGEKQPLPLFEEFVEGYVSKGRLGPDEADMVADLINLRILSNVMIIIV